MSDKPIQQTQQTSDSTTQIWNGAWFRRERERVAIGRKPLSLRLGTTEPKLGALEVRNQPVPLDWFPTLRELGFRIPSEHPQGAPASVPASEQKEVPAQVIDQSPVVEPVVLAPVVVDSSAVETVVAAPAVEVPSPVAVEPPRIVDAEVVANAEAAARAEAIEEAKVEAKADAGPPLEFFHGRWLRAMRSERAVQTSLLLKQLGASRAELYTLERHNIRLPLRWIPRLLKLGLLTVEQAKAAARLPVGSQLHGQWLQKQRAAHKLTPEALVKHLPATVSDIRQVEARSWPLPSEWFPILKTLFNRKKKSASKRNEVAVASAATPTTTKSKAESKAKTKAEKPAAQPAVTTAAAKSTVPASAKSPAKKPAKTPVSAATPVAAPPKAGAASAKADEADLSEMIVSYRLTLGQHAGIPAVTVLAQIASDLQLAKGREAISYPALRSAMKTLLRG